MTRRVVAGFIAAVVPSLLIAHGAAGAPGFGAAQTPVRDARPNVAAAPTGTATISGAVVSAAGASSPIRFAYVVLIGAATGVLRVTSSDDRGRFSFANLPADRYVVGASKPPYLGSVAGAKRPARAGTPIAVQDGETIGNVTIRMPLGGAISGVLTDEQGQPAAGARIGLQQRTMRGGERVWSSIGGTPTVTDERGRYRFHTLPPGEYAVVAMFFGGPSSLRVLKDADVDAALKGARVQSASATNPIAMPAPVYFPGTTRESDATAIAIAAGEERQNVDFRLEVVRTANIEGAVATADGQPAAGVSVSLTTASSSNPLQRTTATRVLPDGSFKFSYMPPGSYLLVAREAAAPGRFASLPIEVTGVDLTGLQLALRPPLAFSARIVFEGTTTAPALGGRRVPIRMLNAGGNTGTLPQVAVTGASGTFSVTGLLPGQYVLGGPLVFGATNDSVTWALQSVVADGRDVTDLPLVISADVLPKDVVVTYGDRWQELSGQLRQSSNLPATEYTIVVFPVDKKYWLPGSRRILTVRPASDGRFRLGGPGPTALPPGAYLLAAVTDLERDEQFDPSFLDALVSSAVPVTLQPGERKVQDVVIK